MMIVADYKLLAIVGETASGKSALAMDIARRYDGEIICADAWTVYPGFDIGTAKPSKSDQQFIVHHLLDVADPATGFSVVEFQERAKAAIAGTLERGRLPILVGGSGLYVDSVLYDYHFTQNDNRYERDVLNTMSAAELVALAKDRGLILGNVDTQNPRRLIRLIERDGAVTSRSELLPGACIVGLKTTRETLRANVARRVHAMIEAGLENEVLDISGRYGWDAEAMKGIGYREWKARFESGLSIEAVESAIVSSTMKLAKKQRTWFERNPDIHWFSKPGQAIVYVEHWLHRH